MSSNQNGAPPPDAFMSVSRGALADQMRDAIINVVFWAANKPDNHNEHLTWKTASQKLIELAQPSNIHIPGQDSAILAFEHRRDTNVACSTTATEDEIYEAIDRLWKFQESLLAAMGSDSASITPISDKPVDGLKPGETTEIPMTPLNRVDTKADTDKKRRNLKVPKSSDVLALIRKLNDRPNGTSKTEVARDFTNGDDVRAGSLLRQVRNYPHMLNADT